MGASRARRPFVWQDEMAEVRNLFRRVAKVRDSGFTGFSLGKDEPTAETLSRNRLRRRQCQYASELTHLNYGESPYEALNHLHNIRGMCSRIQRQDRYVERKKKDYDLDLQPALLRRPVTASYSNWYSNKEGSDKGSVKSSRPGSAPVMAGTPLYYTPSKPTTLYDATHRCPRNKELVTNRSSMLNPGKIHHRRGRTALSAVGNNNYSWETTSRYSSSVPPSSIASSTKTNKRVAPSGSSSSRRSVNSSARLDESMTMPGKSFEPVYGEAGTASDDENTAAFSELEPAEASVSSSSRAPGVNVVERPPSRMMSKRPSADLTKAILAEKHDSTHIPNLRDDHAPPRESAGHELTGSIFASSARQVNNDAVSTQRSKHPSCGTVEGGRLFEEQMCKSNRAGAGTSKGKSAGASDKNAGLWALRHEQQRPTSGGMMPRAASASPSSEEAHVRPGTSPPNRVGVQNFPRLERVNRFGSSPSANKIAGKKEQLKVRAVQRTFDQELQTAVHFEYGSHGTHGKSTRSEQQELKPPDLSPAQPHQRQQDQTDAFESGGDKFKEASIASARVNERKTTTASGGDESHVLIRHSTDPYTDFKYSMLRMIDEENLYDKQWELEELFLYYIDLNPAVHHAVLQMVISDIRKNIETYKARRCYSDSPLSYSDLNQCCRRVRSTE